MNELTDWKIPKGISRRLWTYVADAEIARSYDGRLAESPLLHVDLQFTTRIFTAPGRLVDLGCGTGRLLIPFAARGFTVVGIDLSPEMLKVASAKASAANLSLALVRANLVELDCMASASFDYAACLFSTLGMVTGPGARQQMLAHAYRILRPGGRLVLHVHNRGFHAWTRAGRRWLCHDWWRRLRRDESAGDYEMPPHGGLTGLSLHHFSRREALRSLKRSGFRICQVRPLSLRPDCRLPFPWWLGCLRAYGYLIAAEKPDIFGSNK